MADFDINNPNEFVPGGLSALGTKTPIVGGGLTTEAGQQRLEEILFPRLRDQAQIDQARSARRGALGQLQTAIETPSNNFTGLDHILMGMASNDRPWDVGNGFRSGVANAMAARLGLQKESQAAKVQSALAGLKFEQDEGENDDAMEKDAIANLRTLAKPVKLGSVGGAGGAGSGVRFKNVPGVGLVDTQNVDEEGRPKLVYGDGKTLTEVRQKARKLAEAQAESEQNNMTFESDRDREQFISSRTDEIAAQMLAGSVPGSMGNTARPLPTERPAAAKSASAATASKNNLGFPAGTQLPAATDTGTSRFEILSAELADAQQKGKTRDVESITREINNLPAAERKGFTAAAAAPVEAVAAADRRIDGPEVQRAKIKTAEEVAKAQAGAADQIRNEMVVGQNIKSTVDELRQLKFNPGMFAKWKQRGGNLMEAFGVDGPLAKMAAQSGNAEALLQALSNARISLEKGVQTRDDEIRFKREIASITDPKEAYQYMLKHMYEIGNKAEEKYHSYEDFRKSKGGTSYDGADQAWLDRSSKYGGMVKRYGGGFVGRSEFINAMVTDPANLKAYGGDKAKLQQRAESEWLRLGGK